MEVGPLRVYPGGYAISRSLGDFDCKHIIADPEVCALGRSPATPRSLARACPP